MGVKNAATNDFNSHAHVERDSPLLYPAADSRDFNSHAHVERDFTIPKREELKNISTHTLTWSVTVQKKSTAQRPQISTHTLTWSVTKPSLRIELADEISTHTLTWSVTSKKSRDTTETSFQLTRSRGA